MDFLPSTAPPNPCHTHFFLLSFLLPDALLCICLLIFMLSILILTLGELMELTFSNWNYIYGKTLLNLCVYFKANTFTTFYKGMSKAWEQHCLWLLESTIGERSTFHLFPPAESNTLKIHISHSVWLLIAVGWVGYTFSVAFCLKDGVWRGRADDDTTEWVTKHDRLQWLVARILSEKGLLHNKHHSSSFLWGQGPPTLDHDYNSLSHENEWVGEWVYMVCILGETKHMQKKELLKIKTAL